MHSDTETQRVEVRDLRKGDVLVPTKRTVTRAPQRGAKTPVGKVDLRLDGRRVEFGAYTVVTIALREGEAPQRAVDLSFRDTVDPVFEKPARKARRFQ
jgi:hypothetical protein